MTPAERIDSILKERNLSRRQVAIKAKIPPSSFQSAMERNKNLSIDMLQKISDALNVSIFDLMGVDEDDGLVSFSIPPELAEKMGLTGLSEGTINAEIEPGSDAANAFMSYLYEQKQAKSIIQRITEGIKGGGFTKLSDSETQKAGILQFNSDADRLSYFYSKLNDEGQRVAADRVQELSEIPKYQKTPEEK